MDQLIQYKAHQDRLSTLGKHWHTKLWEGHKNWVGDPFLILCHNVLTDEIELRYDVPNEKSQLVFRIDTSDFDIDILCDRLAYADNLRVPVAAKVKEVDDYNEAVEKEAARVKADQDEELVDKLWFAFRKDTGNHVNQILVP
jgi:hypothetical protein